MHMRMCTCANAALLFLPEDYSTVVVPSSSPSSKVCAFVKTHLCSNLRPEAVWNCVDCVPVWPCSIFWFAVKQP